MVACNDYILLESCIYRILQRHFAAAPYYAQLLELFHEVGPVSSCCCMHACQVVHALACSMTSEVVCCACHVMLANLSQGAANTAAFVFKG